MIGPKKFIEHLSVEFYHPRSNAHSNNICLGLVEDIITNCSILSERAKSGLLVAKLNITQTVSFSRWNIDLALGTPPGRPIPPDRGQLIRFAVPAIIQIAVEAKGIMTEHGKARHNRLRDFQAFHDHAHQYDNSTIACGIVVVNVSPQYWSPTRDESDITVHKNISRISKETVDIFRNLPLRSNDLSLKGLEGMCVMVVDHDNFGKNPNLPDKFKPKKTTLVEASPAPKIGDPLNYATLVQRICITYENRFA